MITFKAKDASGEIINSALSPFQFPAGEVHIKREERRELEETEIAVVQFTPLSLHDDLFTLSMWRDYINHIKPHTKTVLVLPYVPGARADRGEPFGLEVYASFLNNLKFDQTIIFDPHSPVASYLLTGPLTIMYQDEFFSIPTIKRKFSGYTGIIAPDKGAVDRAQGVADVLGVPLYTAEKTRDFTTGKLTGFQLDGLPVEGTYLIADDICDRGGTFNGLAQAISIPKERLDLFVSHGVFSSDARTTLQENFGNVFSTNSYDPKKQLNYTLSSRYGQTKLKFNAFTRLDVIRPLLSKIK